MSVEVMSRALTRISDDVDTQVTVRDATGAPLNYYGVSAFNDDELETLDSHIFDLIIPEDGIYYVEVNKFNTSTGDYELFVQTFGTFGLPGDANDDGTVDLEDFVILRNNFSGMGGFGQGDFNGDGVIDLEDFVILRNNFGGPDASPMDGWPSTVPEPGSLALASLAGLAMLRRRK